jgi:hypothetical protein
MLTQLRFAVLLGTTLATTPLLGSLNVAHAQSSSSPANSPSPVYATDVNADGKPDLLSATAGSDEVAWHRRAEEGFSDRTVITDQANGAHSVIGADLDGDGDADVLSASRFDNKIAWYENTDGYGRFSDQKVIANEASDPQSIVAADFDGDGDQDLLYCSWEDGKVAWYENTDGAGSFSDVNVISNNAGGAEAVYAADLDGDGDKDALSASSSVGGTNKIAWYRNTAGGFASQNIISQKMRGARVVLAADLDGDGDQDVLSASTGDGKVAWYENTDGYGTFSKQRVITTKARGARSLSAADLDGDGDLDVLSASTKNGMLAWYENTDGSGSFSGPKVISSTASYASVFTADVDGDGDPDVLSGSEKNAQITWFRNDLDEGAGFGTAQPVVRQLAEAK